MPHPAFAGYRTPKKPKIWAAYYPGFSSMAVNSTERSDMLTAYKSAMGAGTQDTRPLTVMRIIGNVGTFEEGAASTPVHGAVQLGIAWVNNAIQTTNIGILEEGTRELEWLWRGSILCAESSSIVSGRGTQTVPQERNNISFDIKQMRKQPTPQHSLSMVWKLDSGFEANTCYIRYWSQVWMAY